MSQGVANGGSSVISGGGGSNTIIQYPNGVTAINVMTGQLQFFSETGTLLCQMADGDIFFYSIAPEFGITPASGFVADESQIRSDGNGNLVALGLTVGNGGLTTTGTGGITTPNSVKCAVLNSQSGNWIINNDGSFNFGNGNFFLTSGGIINNGGPGITIGTSLQVNSFGCQGLTATGSLNTSVAVKINNAGNTLQVKSGANACIGTVVLNGATGVAVATTAVTANSRIFLTMLTSGGTPAGVIIMVSVTPGTGFTVKGVALDTSTYSWFIVESQ